LPLRTLIPRKYNINWSDKVETKLLQRKNTFVSSDEENMGFKWRCHRIKEQTNQCHHMKTIQS